MIKRFKKWNEWRKHNLNGPLHHFLVLIGFIKSPTFEMFITNDEIAKALQGLAYTMNETSKAFSNFGKSIAEALDQDAKNT